MYTINTVLTKYSFDYINFPVFVCLQNCYFITYIVSKQMRAKQFQKNVMYSWKLKKKQKKKLFKCISWSSPPAEFAQLSWLRDLGSHNSSMKLKGIV